MVALATKDSALAAAFTKIGLAPWQHDEYRLALVSAKLTQRAVTVSLSDILERTDSVDPSLVAENPVDRNSVIGRNVLLLEAHHKEMETLDCTYVFGTPQDCPR